MYRKDGDRRDDAHEDQSNGQPQRLPALPNRCQKPGAERASVESPVSDHHACEECVAQGVTMGCVWKVGICGWHVHKGSVVLCRKPVTVFSCRTSPSNGIWHRKIGEQKDRRIPGDATSLPATPEDDRRMG
eukprot:3001600-Rhodomonas_salina.3